MGSVSPFGTTVPQPLLPQCFRGLCASHVAASPLHELPVAPRPVFALLVILSYK